MHKTKNTLLIIAAIIVVGCLLYVPGINDLGLYRDDWNNFYTAYVRGPAMLKEHFSSDRPAMGWLISMLYMIFGTNNLAYNIWNLCCRILGSIFFALTILNVWPKTSKMAGVAGILAVIFPGFLQQVDGIDYTAHQTAMLCFMLSLWLTSLALKPEQKSWNVLFTFLSMCFSLGSMVLMEYYVGMEIYRFCVIYLMNREHAQNGKPKAFFKAVLSYIPYLIPLAGFVGWRVFFFNAERAGTNVMDDVVLPILRQPKHELLELGVRGIKNVWKLFIGVWAVPAYNLLSGLAMKPFLKALIPSLVIFAVAQLFLFLMHRKRTDESVTEAHNEAAQLLWFGLISGAIAIVPLTVAKREIVYSQSLSLERFSWPGMIGAILVLVGLLGSLKDRSMRNLLTMAVILVSVFVQWQNKVNYIDQWAETKDYWQQLMWRAPGLEKGTTIVTQGGLLIEEDYDIFAPASMIYYPEEKEWSPIGAEVLNTNTVQQIKMGRNSNRIIRNIYVERNYDRLLAISKPTAMSCIHVINGEQPIYSASDWTRIPEIGSYSKLGQIITDPEKEPAIPFFLGEEQEHGWCYYYEKMELALQMEDPETAAKLADEAFGKNLKAEDGVEWIPVIEAYIETGRPDDARSIALRLFGNEFMAYNAGAYFAAKENPADYAEVIEVLRPDLFAEMFPEEAAEEAAEETEIPEEVAAEEPAEEAAEETEISEEIAAEEPAEEDITLAIPETGTETTETADPAKEDPAVTEEELTAAEEPASEKTPAEVSESEPAPAEEQAAPDETVPGTDETEADAAEEFLLNNDAEVTENVL